MLPSRGEKLRIAELPEGYRVVGIDEGVFIIRNPSGRDIRIEQDGHLTGVTTRRSLAARHVKHAESLGAETATTRYTSVMD
jgi:hypothetical protein